MARAKKNRRRGKENIIFFFLAIVILWLVANVLIHNVQKQFVKTETVTRMQMEDLVTGYGQLKGGESTVIAQADGVVEPIVKEGERVRKGNAVCKISGAYSYTNYAGRVSYHLDGLEGITDLNSVCCTDLERRYQEQKNRKNQEKEHTASNGDVVAKVTNIFDDVYVYLTVPATEYTASLETGKPVLLRFVDAETEMRGTLQEALDTQDGHRYLKLKLRAPKESMFDRELYRIDMPYNQMDAITVPQEALVVRNGETGVYYLQKGFAFWKPVTTGESRDNRVVITEGLSAGSIVVTTPKLVREGTRLSSF